MIAIDKLENTYQKNILYFKKNYPDLYLKLSIHIENQRYELIYDDEGYFNIEVIASRKKIYESNSNLIAEQQVDVCLKNSSKIKKAVFVGTLLGFQIERLISKTDLSCIAIIEPDLELFKLSTFLIDYEVCTKNKYTIFSVGNTEKNLEKHTLEFFYTMFYKNNDILFLTSVDEYQVLLNKIDQIHKENIFYSIDFKNIKIPKNKKNIDIDLYLKKAKRENEKKNYIEAIDNYLQVIEFEQYSSENIKEKIFEAYLNLGNIYYNLRSTAEAYHCYGKCIYSNGVNNEIYEAALCNYALINRLAQNAYANTMELLDSHIKKGTNHAKVISSYAALLYDTNQYKKAEEYLKPYNSILKEANDLLSMITPLPIVYDSQSDIDRARNKLESQLDNLLTQKIVIPESELSIFTFFYLAYHNKNNKDILVKLSKFYEQTTPSILYTAKHCKKYKYSGKKIKLGIISNHLTPGHPVLKFMENIINSFSNSYDLHIFTFSKKTQEVFSKNIHLLTSSSKEQRELISKYKLDIILYPEIGMHQGTYILAHARLAPIQCMFGGHPVTTGIKNIDYYFSQKDLEVEGAQKHYSEELVLFENFIASYQKPEIPKKFISKSKLGLLKNRHNYLIPSKLQKIHPDFDKLLAGIVQKDDKALFIFFKDNGSNQWDDFVRKRLLKNLDKEYLVFRPWADSETFYSLLHHTDAVLEPTVFGYGTTAIEALSIGTPIITLPSDYPGGRIMQAFYKKINFKELIATDMKEYISQAIKLATDNSFKTYCKKSILKSNKTLYENSEVVDEIDIFFKKVLS